MVETALVPASDSPASIMERVIVAGDLAKLTPQERVTYYMRTCESLGLNPLTKPFDYIVLNGKLTLYANRSAADQLRRLRSVSIVDVDIQIVAEAYVVKVRGKDVDGREDVDVGYVSSKGLVGEAVGNAMKKAVTQGKRRLTLSLVGLGWLDETEITQIPDATDPNVDPLTGEIRKVQTLAEKVATKRAEIGPTNGAAEVLDAVCGSENKTLDTGVCEKPKGHTGPHKNASGVWPA